MQIEILTKNDLNQFKTELLEELKQIPFVSEAISLGSGRYHLLSAPEHDIREGLFKLASSKSWIIRELKEEKSSVEEAFNELTKNQ